MAAVLLLAADLALTGMLHFDGLLDSADGLLPHLRPAAPADRHGRARRRRVRRGGSWRYCPAGPLGVGVILKPAVLLVAGLWCGAA